MEVLLLQKEMVVVQMRVMLNSNGWEKTMYKNYLREMNFCVTFLIFIFLVGCSSCKNVNSDPVRVGNADDIKSLAPETSSIFIDDYEDDSLALLKQLDCLEELTVSVDYIGSGPPPSKTTNKTLEYISEIQTLKRIALLHRGKITDEGLQFLSKLKNLEKLEIYYSPLVTDAGIEELKKKLPKCEIILEKILPPPPEEEEPPEE